MVFYTRPHALRENPTERDVPAKGRFMDTAGVWAGVNTHFLSSRVVQTRRFMI